MRAILVQLEMLAITKSEQFLGMLGYDVYEGPYFDGSPKREGLFETSRVCARACV